MLTDDQKRTPLYMSRYFVSCYEDDPGNLIKPVVTQDETWVHHLTQGQKCKANNGSTLVHPPKKFKRVHSAGKVMASIFWVNQGAVMIEQGSTINGIYQSPLTLTALFQHDLINVSYLTGCYLYQVMMTLHFLYDVANGAESTQKIKEYVIIASLKSVQQWVN